MNHFHEAKAKDLQIQQVVGEIEKFTRWIFQHHKVIPVRASKVIHDSVWGTERFEDFEIVFINTPLIQRLRQILQTGNTYLTYPSARHTRFEHTLGVTAQIGNLIQSLNTKFEYSKESASKKHLLGDELLRTLRLASILHDCGHGPLSHTSEEIYGMFPEIRHLKKFDPFKSAGAGEIFSYLILEAKRFREFLSEVKEQFPISTNDELMKNAIVGFINPPEDHYKVDMLHGPFDADKIDYLFRDGHFSGLPLQIDLDRFWYSLDINPVKGRRRLTIDWGGVSCLEQLLLSKMTLYPAVYHHHKVRACDCMFKGIIEYIRDKRICFQRDIEGEKIDIDFSRAVHFLYFTDLDFYDLNIARMDGNLHMLLHNLHYRRLLKRAIVIARDTVTESSIHNLDTYAKYREDPIIEGEDYYRSLAKKIWEEAKKPGLLQEIWVDCPDDPDFEEANDTWISSLGEGLQPLPLSVFFRADKYADQYKQKKWRSHVFCRPEYVNEVAQACVSVFKAEYQIQFLPLAFHLCHISPPGNL
jgi:uncharacterized protein